MKYSEAKQYLKEGMSARLIGTDCCKDEQGTVRTISQNKMRLPVVVWYFRQSEMNGHEFKNGDELEILTNPDGSPWMHPQKFKSRYRVGDIYKWEQKHLFKEVREVKKDKVVFGLAAKTIEEARATENDYNTQGWKREEIDDHMCFVEHGVRGLKVEMVRCDEAMPFWPDIPEDIYKSLTMDWAFGSAPTKPKFMSSIVRKIKDLTLSADDRILRKHGFEDNCKDMTEQTRDMMLEEILADRWASRRADVAKDLKKVEAADKAA
jgi:hypothetical protein